MISTAIRKGIEDMKKQPIGERNDVVILKNVAQ
jgi:hypothetical protein